MCRKWNDHIAVEVSRAQVGEVLWAEKKITIKEVSCRCEVSEKLLVYYFKTFICTFCGANLACRVVTEAPGLSQLLLTFKAPYFVLSRINVGSVRLRQFITSHLATIRHHHAVQDNRKKKRMERLLVNLILFWHLVVKPKHNIAALNWIP